MCIAGMTPPDLSGPGPIPAGQALLEEDPIPSTAANTGPPTTSFDEAAPGSTTGASGGGALFSFDPNNPFNLGEKDKFGGTDGEGGEGDRTGQETQNPNEGRVEDKLPKDDGLGNDDPRVVDENGNPIDDKFFPKDEEDDGKGETKAPSRILSPLIRAVQGERKIDRRGRNALFIPQGSRGGASGVRKIKPPPVRPRGGIGDDSKGRIKPPINPRR